ncbi:MAG: DUF1549 domain-containing protein, partial [Verrucomicrobiota bacterium]
MVPGWWTFLVFLSSAGVMGAEISYNRDVLPILADQCFSCHGADAAQRKAGLRLDDPKVAYAERDGVRAIVPGKIEESALIARILATDDEEVMPPRSETKRLTTDEKRTLRQWIEEGGTYEKHWAFTAPSKALPPEASAWARNPIDPFIETRLRTEGLKPRQTAAKEKLIRRASFDLSGLPPGIDELDSFLNDDSPNAYERLIDRLLASPRYGERMAAWWLDGARYGDSHGYDNDLENTQWPWR